MNDKTDKGSVNYTDEMVATLNAAAPVGFDTNVHALAEKLGKSVASIIAKCKSEGIEYIPKAKPSKKVAKVTKLELVTEIECYTRSELAGLDKAPASALVSLLQAVRGMDHIDFDSE